MNKNNRTFGNKVFFHRRTISSKNGEYGNRSMIGGSESFYRFNEKAINNRSVSGDIDSYSQILNCKNKTAKSVNCHLRSTQSNFTHKMKCSQKAITTQEDRMQNLHRFLRFRRNKIQDQDLPNKYLEYESNTNSQMFSDKETTKSILTKENLSNFNKIIVRERPIKIKKLIEHNKPKEYTILNVEKDIESRFESTEYDPPADPEDIKYMEKLEKLAEEEITKRKQLEADLEELKEMFKFFKNNKE